MNFHTVVDGSLNLFKHPARSSVSREEFLFSDSQTHLFRFSTCGFLAVSFPS
jgi:hypothetical protein